MQDEQIVQLYWNRDQSAIAQTQIKYSAYLTKIAMNILADRQDSEESINDTYLAAWNSMPPQKPSVLSVYLSRLTRRISIDIFRRRTSQKRQGSQYAISLSELDETVSGGTTPEEEVESAQLAQTISDFLRTLPADERNTFIGRYYYMDSLKDVAAYCGMGEAKAKSMLYRTRQKLKLYLEKEGYTV